ncbi:hypothetical protein WJX72_008599 [[Myrmecia] bisecta]|uniref:WLM domain-containing protein n=1 Tax=[Myrmecia] bisecta TaxID=41462 RepID=A0AAW1P8J4_9CHLO
MVALAEEQPFQLSVSYRGKQHQLSLPASSTLEGLGKALERETSAAFETIKLVIPGRKGPPARPATSPAQSLQAAGIPAKGRLMMLASSAAEVEAIQHSRDLPGLAGFDHEHKQAMRRRQHAGGGALVLPKGEYVFQQFRLLPHPALTPPPSEALKLLHRLAADPGIVGIMNKHRWTVGLLSEMPPEGKVGVSAMCILGYNVNQGQEISMRLRTDDLKGFRRYDRIRETLCHELAHMVWGEHDHNFKQLNSQLLRECAEFEAQAQGGHILAGPAFAGDSQANAAWVDEDDAGQDMGRALQTLATVLQNALKDPKEPKFRRVRQQNAAFQTKAGRFPAALDLLRLAGFYPDNSSSDPALVLQRNDPGLLWLTLSAVNAALAGSQS